MPYIMQLLSRKDPLFEWIDGSPNDQLFCASPAKSKKVSQRELMLRVTEVLVPYQRRSAAQL